PTYPKNVHFDAQLEHVRHFLHSERPTAVSATSSPVCETDGLPGLFPWADRAPEWDVRLPNFPAPSPARAAQPVYVERVFLSDDRRVLIIHVAARNLAFSKYVAAKFTVDYWKTVSEIAGDFNDDLKLPRDPGYDRFSISIKLQDFTALESKVMFFCIRYNVNGTEFWDNNGSVNYQVEFLRRPVSVSSSASSSAGSSPASPPLLDLPLSSLPPAVSSAYPHAANSGNNSDSGSLASGTPGPRFLAERPAVDSTSYQAFLDNYCFFQGSPTNGRAGPQSPQTLT
ncbi:putative phosphatase regulatory subunit-domain-containing protein, partial [Dipodascopsis tothii]|uniref:putative phosphatase regulatory subunit-domain-containing protein n=1 Tax=Dipodascopsis tothii TaxID=44089 RepID=UPI0034D0202D